MRAPVIVAPLTWRIGMTAPAPQLGPFLIQKPASHLGPDVGWFTDMLMTRDILLRPWVMIRATFVPRARAGAVVASAAPACCL